MVFKHIFHNFFERLTAYKTLELSSKTFIQRSEAQSSVNKGDPRAGGAENFV